MAGKTARAPHPATAARYQEYADQTRTGVSAQIEWVEADEARSQQIVPISSRKKYVFRTRPGTVPMFSIRIPHLPVRYKDETHRKNMEQRFKERRADYDGENPPFDLEKVRKAVGGNRINFKYIGGRRVPGSTDKLFRGTCYYDTDDEDVYQFLMHLKKKNANGVWSNILVEYPSQTMTINGRAFPVTSAGWEAAQAAIMAGPQSPSEVNTDGNDTSEAENTSSNGDHATS